MARETSVGTARTTINQTKASISQGRAAHFRSTGSGCAHSSTSSRDVQLFTPHSALLGRPGTVAIINAPKRTSSRFGPLVSNASNHRPVTNHPAIPARSPARLDQLIQNAVPGIRCGTLTAPNQGMQRTLRAPRFACALVPLMPNPLGHANMTTPSLLGKHLASGRELFLLDLHSLDEYPSAFIRPSPSFVAILIIDATNISDMAILEFGRKAILQGAAYFVTWGPKCSHVHDVLDLSCIEVEAQRSPDSCILTTWHDDVSLTGALWFALNVAWPDSAYEATCTSALAVVVGSPSWSAEVAGWLNSLP